MNDLLRYEDEISKQLNNIPLPDEDIAWHEMQQLLDKKDDNDPVIPFLLRSGCMLWAVGLLLLGGVLIWYFTTNQKRGNDTKSIIDTTSLTTKATTKANQNSATKTSDINQHTEIIKDTANQDTASENAFTKNNNTKSVATYNGKSHINITTGSAEATDKISRKGNIKIAEKNATTSVKSKAKMQRLTQKKDLQITDTDADNSNDQLKNNADTILKKKAGEPAYIVDTLSKQPLQKQDSTTNKQNKKDTSDTKDKAKKEPERAYAFAVGSAIFQPLSLNGTSAVPYNKDGRKGSLTDYIPSVYFRFIKIDKWFIQSEFRYGAPQYNKPFTYKKEVIDTTLASYTTANYTLKKTYYHQLPFSFNYNIFPRFSLGAGLQYSRFSAAIIQQDKLQRGVQGGDSLVGSKIVTSKADTNFTRSNFQWLAEMQYKWKRFSIGARYTQDLKAYINFTDAVTDVPDSKKNSSFNIFLRYELWNSSKKKK